MTELSAPAAQRAQPRPEQVVGELLRGHAHATPQRQFLTCGASAFDFAALDARTDAVAAGLAAAGVARGDRVAILCANRVEMLELFFAVAKLGAIQVPLNAYLKGEFLRYQLADSRASALVVDASGHAAVAPLLADLPGLRLLVLLDEPAIDTAAPQIEVRRYTELPVSSPAPVVEIAPTDLMSIVYTSGTTGNPKGCMLSHGYYTRAATLSGQMQELTVDDVLLTALPLFHGAARMLVLTAALVHGLPVVVEPDFRPTTFLARAAETGATIANGVGAMGAALLATPPSQHDRTHQLRAAIFVPFPAAMHTAFAQRFGVPTSSELFGQTECVPITYSPLSDPGSSGSCGRPAADLEVELLDDDDRPVPTGAVGEICVRPREPLAMFSGYWNNPEATLATFRTLWHHTGDYGRAERDGFIFFVDRKKDAVRRRGENVSTMELEAAIAVHPAIAEAAAHAVPSDVTDDDIKVCVVLADSESISPAEMFDFFKHHLPYFAIPRYVEIVDELPKNAVARVMKHVLRQRPMTYAVWDFDALGFTVARSERR